MADEGGGRTAQAVGGSGAIKRDLSSTALPDQGAGSKRVRTQDAPDVSKVRNLFGPLSLLGLAWPICRSCTSWAASRVGAEGYRGTPKRSRLA